VGAAEPHVEKSSYHHVDDLEGTRIEVCGQGHPLKAINPMQPYRLQQEIRLARCRDCPGHYVTVCPTCDVHVYDPPRDQTAGRKLQRRSSQPCELGGCSVANVDPVIESAIQAPGGTWRVEVVKRGRGRWYRIVHGDDVIDWLALGSVERILGEAGVDLGAMVDAA
jgi:bifunctional non-homologous end joining protein LigD